MSKGGVKEKAQHSSIGGYNFATEGSGVKKSEVLRG